MPLGLIGTKIGMTQVFEADGTAAPVTVLQLGPCPVLQLRTPERDGYKAVQIGYKDKSRTRATMSERGHVSNSLQSKRRKSSCWPRHTEESRLRAAKGSARVPP